MKKRKDTRILGLADTTNRRPSQSSTTHHATSPRAHISIGSNASRHGDSAEIDTGDPTSALSPKIAPPDADAGRGSRTCGSVGVTKQVHRSVSVLPMPDDNNAGGDDEVESDGDGDTGARPNVINEETSLDAIGDGRWRAGSCATVQPGGGMTMIFFGRGLYSHDGR